MHIFSLNNVAGVILSLHVYCVRNSLFGVQAYKLLLGM